MSRRVIFLGAPGAGKGTQARGLAAEWGVPQVATGDMLREAMAADTPRGRAAKRYVAAGGLVPDDVVIGLVAERLDLPDAAPGFVLDGFPRTMEQAEALDRMMAERGIGLDRVVFLDVAREELLRRLSGRRTCRQCGAGYHLVSTPPREPGRCDNCGGELYQREDDAEAVARRLDVYEGRTAPLLAYYRERKLLSTVDGSGSVEEVAAGIRAAVGAG